MANLIPAAPGWYVREVDEGVESLDPIIAWKAAESAVDGDDILLPFVDAGDAPPMYLSEESFQYFSRSVVYRPNHDPATGSESP